MGANVKPLTHWAIYKGYKLRFATRHPSQVTGLLITPAGEARFTYDPSANVITLPDQQIAINEYGWELEKQNERE